MKIAVLAANGRSGRAFVAAALAAGHTVRAGIFGEANFEDHPNLQVLPCDATDKDDLEILFSEIDAVVSFIGHIKGSAQDVQTLAFRNIVETLQNCGVHRIISLTGTGVRFDGDTISMIDRILNTAVTLVDKHRIRDGRNHVEILKQSGLEWTVVRVLKLTDGTAKPYVLLEHGPAKLFTSRTEVAQAVLQVLEQRSFVRQAPVIGKA